MKRRLPNEIQQSSPSRALATAQLEVHPLRSIGTDTHTHTLGVESLVKCACASGPWRLGSIVSHWNRWAGIGDRNANGRKRESHLALSNETAPIAYPNCNCKTASSHTQIQTIGISVGESVVNTNPFDLFAYSSANGMELPTTRDGGMVKNDWGKKKKPPPDRQR